MSKCKNCNIEILDDSITCPLCKHVLDMDERTEQKLKDALGEDEDFQMYESRSVMYPDIEPAMKRMKFVIKLFVFLSVIIEAVLIYINYITYNGTKWSMICGAGFIYICFTLIYSFQHNNGHRSKMVMQMLVAIFVAIFIDYALGYTGWSVNYAVPCLIMLENLAAIVFMIVNSNNWQGYIMVLIIMLAISIVFVILLAAGVVTRPALTIIAALVSVVLLVGTIIFGDKRARTELKRRFRV